MKAFFEKYFKLWYIGIPIILMVSVFQLVSDLQEQGKLNSPFLYSKIYPLSRSLNGTMTNLKFKLRGEEAHKQKIVILAADDPSIATLGRWPWHRDVYAELIHATFKLGAKAMGLDMVLSESEDRVPEDIFKKIESSNISPDLKNEIRSLNTDSILAEFIQTYKDKLVLGYTPVSFCYPKQESTHKDICPVEDTDLVTIFEEKLGKFALPQEYPGNATDYMSTPLTYYISAVANLPLFNNAAQYAGSFHAIPDPDGYIRRYTLFAINGKKIFPSLALQLAQIAVQEPLEIEFTSDLRIKNIQFKNNFKIHSTPLGHLDLNFHAGNQEKLNYPKISAIDLLKSYQEQNSKIAEIIKDSIVIFGATAVGIHDMRAFPFNPQTPGIEGHATALDNILSSDALRAPSSVKLTWLPLVLLWVMGIFFSILFAKLEAVPSIAAFAGFLLITGIIDLLLFKNYFNYPSAFLLVEVFSAFVLIQSIRYILEEQNKKFIRMAFSHYLAPQVVDYVLKDPSKLEIGGERRELSVLFTDIRGFTTLSEKMEPKELSTFLNEYLTAMTNVIFDYGGTLDKYIGDAVMAFWGAPIFREDHAYQAAIAALHMQKKMGELQVHFNEKYKAELSMGVGINSGIVSVGNMGSNKIFDYTVIGDHVNLASRLEGLNRIYGTGVLCSQYVLDAMPKDLREKIYFRNLDSVKVKGKNNAIDIIELSLEPVEQASYDLFNQAREEFRKQNWDHAAHVFSLSNIQYRSKYGKADSVCQLFIERCEKFKLNPPGADWDGSIEMREKMSLTVLKAGEKLFEEGDQSKSAYFIKKGIVRIYKKKGDSSIEIETLRAGQLLGELAFLDNNPRSASAEAIVETEILEISQKVLEETLTKTPEWLKVLLKTVSNRLRNASNKIRELENPGSAYETDKWGNRSREFVFVTKSELLRFCTGLIVISSRYGEETSLEGVRFPSATLERYTQQVLQLNESKVAHLIELFKLTNLLKNAPDDGPKPTLFLTDAEFLDKFVWFINDQNLLEASKQKTITARGFLLLGLMIKYMHQADEQKDGTQNLNMAHVLNSDGKTVINPPLRADELQELMDQKFITSIKVGSAEDVTVNFQHDKVTFDFRVFRILSELDKLNERKRKVK